MEQIEIFGNGVSGWNVQRRKEKKMYAVTYALISVVGLAEGLLIGYLIWG